MCVWYSASWSSYNILANYKEIQRALFFRGFATEWEVNCRLDYCKVTQKKRICDLWQTVSSNKEIVWMYNKTMSTLMKWIQLIANSSSEHPFSCHCHCTPWDGNCDVLLHPSLIFSNNYIFRLSHPIRCLCGRIRLLYNAWHPMGAAWGHCRLTARRSQVN